MEVIHLVLGKANPDRMNGVNKVVYQLATEQVKAGKIIQVWGITPNPVHDYPQRNFVTKLFKSSSLPFFVSDVLKQEILKHSNAVFHLHGGWIPVYTSLAKFFSIHNIRFVLTPHGAYNQVAMQKSNIIKRIYFHLFERSILNTVSKVHSIGLSEVSGLQKIAPNTKSFLMPYGFESQDKEKLTSFTDEFIVGFVGRLDVYTKGIDLLLQAFKEFRQFKPKSKLWIIGEGKGRDYINDFVKRHKLNNVVLWGQKFGAEKDELISKMHVFAHPSRNEGLPTSVLEAASFGIPAIVTKATNLSEYIQQYKAGIAIADESVEQLTEALHTIYYSCLKNENARYRFGADEMLNEVFLWSVLVHKYDELYQ